MSADKTGGPAFPLVCANYGVSEGMSLRDYFAAKAMQAGFGSPIECTTEGKRYLAEHSYAMADAMLKARAEA